MPSFSKVSRKQAIQHKIWKRRFSHAVVYGAILSNWYGRLTDDIYRHPYDDYTRSSTASPDDQVSYFARYFFWEYVHIYNHPHPYIFVITKSFEDAEYILRVYYRYQL